MRTILSLLTFLVLTNFVNAQTIFKLKNDDPNQDKVGTAQYIPTIANKGIKSNTQVIISDNSLDFKNIVRQPGYEIRFEGSYYRPLLLKNIVGFSRQYKTKVIIDGLIQTNTSSKSFQCADCQNVSFEFQNAKFIGAGNNSGQMVYLYGKWKDCDVNRGYVDQNRNSLRAATNGGAAVQFESYSDPLFSHGTLTIDGTVVRNANDEAFYVMYNRAQKAYLDTLIIRNTDVSKTGRDFWQAANVRNVIIENNRGDSGGLEGNGDHVSGFSLNEKNSNVIVRNNVVTNTPQFMFSGGGGPTLIENNTFQQELAPGGNQGLYLRDGEFILKGNWFNASNSIRSVIGIDKSKLTWDVSNTFIGKQPFYPFPGSTLTEVPVITTESGLIEIEKTSTGQKVFLLYNNQRIQIK